MRHSAHICNIEPIKNIEYAKMSVGKRLRTAIEREYKNLKEFSEAADIPYRTLQEYISDTRSPGADALLKINAKLSVSIDWLLTGEEGSAEYSDPKLKAMAELLEGLNESQRQEVYTVIEKEKRLNRVLADLEELKQMIGKK